MFVAWFNKFLPVFLHENPLLNNLSLLKTNLDTKATEHYFPMLPLFIMLYQVVVTFESVDTIRIKTINDGAVFSLFDIYCQLSKVVFCTRCFKLLSRWIKSRVRRLSRASL